MVGIRILTKEYEEQYNQFLLENEDSLFVCSLKYRDWLRYITKAKDQYFIALEDNKIIACLPSFIKNSEYGNVLNCLPWYGSNPGIITSTIGVEQKLVKLAMLLSLHGLALVNKCVCSTIITRPFESNEAYKEYTFLDSRIGMYTRLPIISENIEKSLMDLFHQKTRNLIRKAQKSGMKYYHSSNIDDLKFLAELHKENLEEVGAPPKPLDVFMEAAKIFEYDKDYRVYIAELDGVKIAGLLLFYFNKTVEYFTPAIKVDYRNLQPMNLLIFYAMKDATEKGYLNWNWGGTKLPGMEGVYHFKKRWGAEESNYYYYTTFYKDLDKIKALGKEGLLKEYPGFYVLPFSELEKNNVSN